MLLSLRWDKAELEKPEVSKGKLWLVIGISASILLEFILTTCK